MCLGGAGCVLGVTECVWVYQRVSGCSSVRLRGAGCVLGVAPCVLGVAGCVLSVAVCFLGVVVCDWVYQHVVVRVFGFSSVCLGGVGCVWV